MQLLLKYGADVNAKVGFSDTALHLAARRGNNEVVNLLLKYGAAINAQDINSYTSFSDILGGSDK
jgi:ankyrin repeat protein